MKLDIARIFEEVVGFYARLPIAQKIALPLLIFGSVSLIVFVTRWAGRAEYRVLFSNLEESDASGIVEHLKDAKIGYRLSDNGRTVEVTPPAVVHEVRLELAGAGLPKGGRVGFELFNETVLGQTGFGERVKFLRALQGELERTIRSLDAVKSARIHITNPKRSVFVKRDVVPTASVLLRLKPGAELTAVQVKGIAHLVAGSVERLTSENVTIMDSQGKLLNEKKDPEDTGGADLDKLEYQRKVESAYAQRIETMLVKLLGPGKAEARVAVELNFNKFEKEEEMYDPAGTVKRSEREVEESAGLTAEGGIPGVISNLTNEPGVLTPPDSSKSSNIRKEAVRNFEVSRSVSRLMSSPGQIEKISVAVLVDGKYDEVEGTDGAIERTYQPLPPEMLAKIEKLVKQTVGYDSVRGDEITVENIRFLEPDESLEEALKSAETGEWIRSGLTWVPVILFLIVILILVKPLVSFLVSPTEGEIDLSRLLPAGVEELEAELEAEKSKVSALPEISGPSIDMQELEALLAENSKMCRENPQQAALLIRYWLNEGRV